MKHYIVLQIGLEVEADNVAEAAEMAEAATRIPAEWRALKPSPLARINGSRGTIGEMCD